MSLLPKTTITPIVSKLQLILRQLSVMSLLHLNWYFESLANLSPNLVLDPMVILLKALAGKVLE